MVEKLSEEMNRLIHRMGREREYKIISGKPKLTVAQIFLMDNNWKIFKEHREIIVGFSFRAGNRCIDTEVGWLR